MDAVAADALALPMREGSCDAAIAGFGVRNLSDLDAGLREIVRVLKPGGRVVILEFSTPPSALVRWGYQLYCNRVLPRVAGVISGNGAAYRYLADSVANFPAAPELADRMRRAGFREVEWRLLTFGVVAIHTATTP